MNEASRFLRPSSMAPTRSSLRPRIPRPRHERASSATACCAKATACGNSRLRALISASRLYSSALRGLSSRARLRASSKRPWSPCRKRAAASADSAGSEAGFWPSTASASRAAPSRSSCSRNTSDRNTRASARAGSTPRLRWIASTTPGIPLKSITRALASNARGCEGFRSSASFTVASASGPLYFSRNSSARRTRASTLSASASVASSKAFSASLKSGGSSAPR